MKKSNIPVSMVPFTDEEQIALTQRLEGMTLPDLRAYADAARAALANKALESTWKPRIEFGLTTAEAAISSRPDLPA